MKKNLILMLILMVLVAAPMFADDIMLMAPYATLVTNGALVLENGNTNIGWWESLDDQIIWTADIPRRGNYTVKVVYSVAEEFAGSTVNVTVGGETMEWKLESTGDWSNYTTAEVGSVRLSKGSVEVKLQAIDIPDRFVGNVQVVLLTK